MLTRTFYTFLFLLCGLHTSSAQKIFQMDMNKWGGTFNFYVGDVVEFQLEGGDDWYQYVISDMDVDKQCLYFGEIELNISRITKLFVVKEKTKTAVYGFSGTLGTFGLTWTGYATVLAIAGSPAVGPVTFAVGGIALGTAAFLAWAKFMWKRKYKVTEKRRLRIVDITIYQPRA